MHHGTFPLAYMRLCHDDYTHDDVIKYRHFPRYWPLMRGIHRSPVNSPHKGQWRGALMFSLICAWINGLNKQWWGWWFETPLRPLWRHWGVGSNKQPYRNVFARASQNVYQRKPKQFFKILHPPIPENIVCSLWWRLEPSAYGRYETSGFFSGGEGRPVCLGSSMSPE